MESRLLLDVVVLESPTILELLTGANETLLIHGITVLILELGTNFIEAVRALFVKGDQRKTETGRVVGARELPAWGRERRVREEEEEEENTLKRLCSCCFCLCAARLLIDSLTFQCFCRTSRVLNLMICF